MLETDYKIAQGISYVVFFVSYIVSILLLSKISLFLASRVQGAAVLFILTYAVGFVLMIFVFPKIILYIIGKG